MECPKWCAEEHPIPGIQHHTTRVAVLPDPSSLVAYGQRTDYRDRSAPPSVNVSAVPRSSARVELTPEDARNLGVILDDAAKSGTKGIRMLSRALRDLSVEMEAE